MANLVKFGSWPEAMGYARAGRPLYYQAPMDHHAMRFLPGGNQGLGYEVKGRTIRLWPIGSVGRGKSRTSDPFNADAKHLDRFSRPEEKKVESSGMREHRMRETETLPVIFRVERSGDYMGTVTAVFPTLPGTGAEDFTVYEHTGQHSTGTLDWYTRTRAATPAQYAPLLAEIQRIYEQGRDPVKLKVVDKITRKHNDERRENTRGTREHRMRSKRQPSLPGFPDIPEKLEIRIPDMPIWEQIDGDMDPGAYGGTIAKSDGDAIELLKIQPVREYVGDKEAADVGYPFWTREAYFTLEDLDPNDEDVKSALDSIGMDMYEFSEKYTPEQRALTIASALLDYGKADEGPAGWSEDIIHDKVKWHSGKVAGAEYIADEDEAYAQDVLLGDFEVDYEKYAPNEKEPTSGLKVAVSNGNVEIVEWTDIVDATGEDQPEGEEVTRQSVDVALSELLDSKGKHRGSYSGDDKTVSIVELAKMESDEEREEAVVAAAIAYLAYHGGTEEYVDQIGD